MIAVVAAKGLVTFAAAGGGSSGFSFHGGGGGGRGAALYLLFQLLFRLLLFGHGIGVVIVVGLILVLVAFSYVSPRAEAFWQGWRRSGRGDRRAVARRRRRVELAAAEAADEDDAFSPERVRSDAASLFKSIQSAWDRADLPALQQLVAPGLFSEWERRLDDFEQRGWRNHVRPIGEPKVEYVGLRHTGERDGDRVVVRIEAKLRDYVVDRHGNEIKRAGSIGETVRLREFWTLVRRGSRWVLASVEQGAEGSHALNDELVASPWEDEKAMRDEALVEGAVAQSVPAGTKIAELADLDFDGDARAAALDLSLADGRFAPDVLEVAARRAVDAWAEAVDGEDTRLLQIAHPDAAREMLHPGDPGANTRLIVRGPRVMQIRIVSLDAERVPPAMTIDVELSGKRYLQERDTAAVVAGNQWRETSFTERWTLTLDGDAAQPWHIATVRTPAVR